MITRFYQQIGLRFSFTNIDNTFSEKKPRYRVISGGAAASAYAVTVLPPYISPVKSLKALQTAGSLLESWLQPGSGVFITAEQVNTILDFVESEFGLFSKVLAGYDPVFALVDCCHSEFNSEIVLLHNASGRGILRHFVFNIKPDAIEEVTPEYVFFHELGHAMQIEHDETLEAFPESAVETLLANGFPGFRSIPLYNQQEIFADMMSVGLMFHSPYQELNPFTRLLEPQHQEAYHLLVKKLLEPDK